MHRIAFVLPLTAEWDLADPSWRYDAIPEIVDGRNVADYIDPDIMQKLADLEVGQRLVLARLIHQPVILHGSIHRLNSPFFLLFSANFHCLPYSAKKRRVRRPENTSPKARTMNPKTFATRRGRKCRAAVPLRSISIFRRVVHAPYSLLQRPTEAPGASCCQPTQTSGERPSHASADSSARKLKLEG